MLKSKINRTQLAAAVASLSVLFGLELDADQQVAVVVAIQLAANVATFVFRTWFTKPGA